MQASETKLQELIQGVKQFVIPLFQRSYTWGDKREWQVLWDDIIELYNQENPRTHFIGSIVNMPTVSVPEGVAKYLVIDGQQRLTTFYIILSILRDKYKSMGNEELADEIHETFLVNKFKKELEYYKLLPTHKFNDRDAYFSIINSCMDDSENQIVKAYHFFERKIRQQSDIDFQKFAKIITNYLSLVSITLDPNDNPYLVFESLNAKGTPLNAADLIRNYFFMRIHVNDQESKFKEYWEPMENRLGENLTEFIRHFLMIDGSIVNKSDVYYNLKEKVSPENAITYLKKMNDYSIYYERIISPEKEPDSSISNYLHRLNRIEVTTSYPMLLNFYNYYQMNKIDASIFLKILVILENYLIRRFISGKPTRELNKIFPSIIKSFDINIDIVDQLIKLFSVKGYPKDYEFEQRFINMKFYGGADLLTKTRLILESVEDSFQHKERSRYNNLTIEHVMPQTLSDKWIEDIGEDWETTHEIYLHTIGNLTLSAYNSEMSNKSYSDKMEQFKSSHLDINNYFSTVSTWNKEQIELRTKELLKICNTIWAYFGDDNILSQNSDVTGMSPYKVKILNQNYEVSSWRHVFQRTLEVINDLEPELMMKIKNDFPKYVGQNQDQFREPKKLSNGYFYEANLSAATIYKLCNQIIDTIGLTSEDWIVEYN